MNLMMPANNNDLVATDDNFSLRLARKPEAIVAEARIAAEALLQAVRHNGWAQKFGAKEHLFFEAWAFLGSMYRVIPRIKETRLVQIGDVLGYEALAEAFHVPTGLVISTADAMCLNDEDNWSLRAEYQWQGPNGNRERVKVGDKPVPLFQLRSMAQTRAMSKALRGPFSWVVAMAGYAPVPVTDMAGGEPLDGDPQPQRQPRQSAPANGGAARKISEAQGKRLWALAHTANKAKEEVLLILQHFGFGSQADVTTDKYDAICAEIQRSDAQ